MKNNKNKLAPDFIQIPYQLISDKDLAPIDRLVYGAVYFYSKMRGERCFATNTAIASLLSSTPKTVSRALQKLADKKYIIRGYSDPETKVNRVEIIPMVAMSHLNRRILNTPNRVLEGQKDTTPNGVGDTPNEVPPSSKWSRVENIGISDNFIEEKAQNKDIVNETPLFRGTPNGTSNRESIENTIDNTKEDYWGGPSDAPQKEYIPSGNFTKKVRALSRYENLADVPEQDVSDGIALFLPVFPDQFVTKNPFAIPPNRMAVKKILMRLTLAELKEIIDKYVSKKGDPYRPEANTIATFCNFKFDRIEAFIKKSAGNLWAHRSISSPEQRADSDMMIRKIIEEGREKTRKAKEQWLKDHPTE